MSYQRGFDTTAKFVGTRLGNYNAVEGRIDRLEVKRCTPSICSLSVELGGHSSGKDVLGETREKGKP